MLVDDEPDILDFLGYNLVKSGFQIITASSGRDAIRKAIRERPDVIVLDIMMPQKDGGEVLSELRRDPYLRPIPVILLTGLADEAAGIARLGGIESSVFGKPVEFRVLVHEIDRQLGRRVA